MKKLKIKHIVRPNYSLTTGIFLLLITMTGLEAHSQLPDNHKLWFTPNFASVDMLDLFNNPEQWDSARSKTDVFKFYTVQVGTGGWSCVDHPAYNCGDNHLENFVEVQAFSKLGQWGIDIAVESFFAEPVMSYDPIECSTAEYVYNLTLDGSINVIQSIEANGGVVRYLAMDEPIRRWYPLYHYIYWGETDPRPCLVDSLGELADHVAAYINQMQIWFPSVSIGQIGLYPEVGIDQFKEWIIALEARGVSLPFLHIDVHGARVDQYISFGMDINIVADLTELKSFLEARGIEFGIIFSDIYWTTQYWEPDEYDDQFYYERTMDWVNFVKAGNIEHDHSIFQSWIFPVYTTGYGPNEIPVNLPDNDTSIYSHTRLINEGYNVLNSPSVGLPDPMTAISEKFVLYQNYPNPFNSETTIPYSLENSTHVQIKIYNIQGLLIRTLTDEQKPAGEHQVIWNGQNLQGLKVPDGIYICSMSAYGQTLARRFVFMRK